MGNKYNLYIAKFSGQFSELTLLSLLLVALNSAITPSFLTRSFHLTSRTPHFLAFSYLTGLFPASFVVSSSLPFTELSCGFLSLFYIHYNLKIFVNDCSIEQNLIGLHYLILSIMSERNKKWQNFFCSLAFFLWSLLIQQLLNHWTTIHMHSIKLLIKIPLSTAFFSSSLSHVSTLLMVLAGITSKLVLRTLFSGSL